MLRLFNTLTSKKEEFRAINAPRVGMYNCGPTVYDYVHIGNLRSYVFADVLRRVLELNGYKVEQVVNITDVGHLSTDADEGEDKMTKALKRESKPMTLEAMREVAEHYTHAFEKNLDALNIERPHRLPRASEHIDDQIRLIKDLEHKELTYKTKDGIYFDTSRFENYGALGGVRKEHDTEHARIAANPEKRNPRDFALWKFNNELGWETPWGKGFPGWHIECSAMSMKYLGEHFDIHTGGIDHIPIHHNNEIAQSESYSGKDFVNYWLHNAFVTINDERMAKSAETGITLQTLTNDGYSPLSYRYWLLTAHYRSPVNFTWDALRAAVQALERIRRYVVTLPNQTGTPDKTYLEKFKEFINDDMNTPQALALLWQLVKDDKITPSDKKTTLLAFDSVFGLGLDTLTPLVVPQKIQKLVADREEAREKENWEKADTIRKAVEKAGYIINDTDDGPEIAEK